MPEVLESLKKKRPEFWAQIAGRTRKAQLQVIRRLVRRAERRDAWRFTKRVDGDLFVCIDALEALLPVDIETVAAVEKGLTDLNERHMGLQRQVNGHGSKLRSHGERLTILERKQELTAKFMIAYAEADSSA